MRSQQCFTHLGKMICLIRIIANDSIFMCKKNYTSKQKPQRCISFMPSFQPFKGVCLTRGFFFLCSTAFSLIIFCAIFRASNHQLVDKKNKTEMLFKHSNLNSNHTLTQGYLNPALNNLAQGFLGLPQAGSHE